MKLHKINSMMERLAFFTIEKHSYEQGMKDLHRYLSSNKFIPTDGRHHGSVNVSDIFLRLNEMQDNAGNSIPEFVLNSMNCSCFRVNIREASDEGYEMEIEYKPIEGKFKTRYDACVFAIVHYYGAWVVAHHKI